MDRKRYLETYLSGYRAERRFLNLALDKADHARLAKAAAREGKKPGRFAIEIALRHVDGEVYVPALLKTELQALRYLIRNIANNLNQIAHHTNTVKKAADERAVFQELRRLEAAVEDFTSGRLAERIKATPPETLKLHLQTLDDHQIHEP